MRRVKSQNGGNLVPVVMYCVPSCLMSVDLGFRNSVINVKCSDKGRTLLVVVCVCEFHSSGENFIVTGLRGVE